VVERRKASASRWTRVPYPFDASSLQHMRLPAFRFLFLFLSFVIAGLDPAIQAAAKLI
jgi:hypothetical protein